MYFGPRIVQIACAILLMTMEAEPLKFQMHLKFFDNGLHPQGSTMLLQFVFQQ